MFTEQAALLAELKPLFAKGGLDGDRIANVLAKYTANCVANLVHRGTLSLEQVANAGRRDATLTVKRFPAQPDTYATEEPSNGYAADFWGKVRFRGHVQFDQGGGAIINYAQLLALFPVGFQMPWHNESDIPTGWAIMDGVANAAGSGIDRGGRVGYGYISGDPTFGTLGASVAIAFSADIQSGNPTFALTVNSATTGITLSAHAASSGGTTVSTEVDIWSVDDAPGTGLEAFDGTNADATFLSGDANDITDVGHDHNILKSNIAAALADHTITEPSAGAGHNHTATIDADGFADELNIALPTTLQPLGVVELWIEKLS